MPYEPTNWKTGDIVTSEKLNKLEDGVASIGENIDNIVEVNAVEKYREDIGMRVLELDKTWQEIYDMVLNGTKVLMCDRRFEYSEAEPVVIQLSYILAKVSYTKDLETSEIEYNVYSVSRGYSTNSPDNYPYTPTD